MNGLKNYGKVTQWNTMKQEGRQSSYSLRQTAWMELESIMLSEISQVVKDKYMISPISRT